MHTEIVWFVACAPGHKFNKVEGNKAALLNLSKEDKVRAIIGFSLPYFYLFSRLIWDAYISFQAGGYIFEFESVGNRDLCRDFVGNIHFVVSGYQQNM